LPALGELAVPIHIAWGAEDAVAPLDVARHLKDVVCPQAKFTAMTGVGHFCQQEDPQVWLETTLAFWAR
jgi:pimeloyl-ACP methyl ester carboxylesterase